MTELASLFIDLVRVETRLYNHVDRRLQAAHGLSAGQFQLLQVIAEREGCRVLDIVQEVDITVGAASKAVDRLEAAKWCRRTAHPTDRRSSILTLTPAGERVLAAARPTFEDEIAQRITGVVSDRALRQVSSTLAAIRSALEA